KEMSYGLMSIKDLKEVNRRLLAEDARLRKEGLHFDHPRRAGIHREVKKLMEVLKFKKHLASLS
ncbi:MAG: hypothetical protein KDB14_35080, partial [Planctomycetales bacterium]|nr:hypothetical protein [Planctomycetales bacterium]